MSGAHGGRGDVDVVGIDVGVGVGVGVDVGVGAVIGDIQRSNDWWVKITESKVKCISVEHNYEISIGVKEPHRGNAQLYTQDFYP